MNLPPHFATKTRGFLALGICLVTFNTLLGMQGVDTEKVQTAITRAIPSLELGSQGAVKQRQCFTCHHQALPAVALHRAKKGGFKISEESIQSLVDHTYNHLKSGNEQYKQGKGQGGQSLTAGYALWTLDETEFARNEITDAVVRYLVDFQRGDRRWHHHSGRPPTSDSDFSATYFVMKSLRKYKFDEIDEALNSRWKEAKEWLISSEAKDNEDRVFRLGGLAVAECDGEAIADAAKAIIDTQREDGGWAQLPDMESDPYATATSLFALLEYSGETFGSKTIDRGIDYLLKSQGEDGTWHVVTRAKPFQTYFESGFPHGKDQFLSIAASSWATISLLEYLRHKGADQAGTEKEVPFRQTLPIPKSDEKPGNEKVDALVEQFLLDYNVPGVSIAVSDRKGLRWARSYGYSDIETKEVVDEQSLFRIASVSKPITAIAVMQLVEQKQLGLDDKIFDLFEWEEQAKQIGSRFDSRLRDVTIRQLLDHRGGWDRDQSFDPMFSSRRLRQHLGLDLPLKAEDLIRCMLYEPLDFDPGSRFAYSNFGYAILGRIIEKKSGVTYETYVQEQIFKPIGITRMKIGRSQLQERSPGEVHYYDSGTGKSVFDDQTVASPYGVWSIESMDSHGGWISSASDLVKLASALDDRADRLESKPAILKNSSLDLMFPTENASGKSRSERVFYSMGWEHRVVARGKMNHWHTGSLPGTTAILIKRYDGFNMAALLNTRQEKEKSTKSPGIGTAIDRLLHRVVERLE